MFWEQASAGLCRLLARSCVICITMGQQFKLLRSAIGLLICEGAGKNIPVRMCKELQGELLGVGFSVLWFCFMNLPSGMRSFEFFQCMTL